jgi:hypothetical protein
MDRLFLLPSGSTTILAPPKRKKTAAAPAVVTNDPASNSPSSSLEHLDPTSDSSSPVGSPLTPLDSASDTRDAPLDPTSNTSSDSDSSSDSNVAIYKSKSKMTTPSTDLVPSVEHHALHHAPILTAGVPTPALLLEFEDACEDFFANVKGGITEDVKVTRILPGFKDPIIRGWISSDRAHLSSLKFDAYMKLLRSKFLSKQWEDELLSKILRNHLRQGQEFLTWATQLQQQNCILRNTDSQLDEKRLREQISIAVDMDLRIAAREAKVNDATSLRDFLDIYTLCDQKRRASESRTRSIIDESYRKNKNANKDNAFHPYKKDGRNTSASQTFSTSTSLRPPKLTPLEIEIIKSCSGCFKCRKIYLSKEHINTEAAKKTCDFPSAENYRALTWEYANKVKAARDARKTSSSSKSIAATSSATSSSSNPSTSSIVEANSSEESNFVASMFGPLAASAVIGNGSFSSEGDSSVCQPFKSKHFVWKCTVNGPADEFPIKISTLIDNGAHMVLIRPETVKQLGLSSFPLPRPEEVDVAISSSTSSKRILSHFVKFKATSLDGLWTSRTVYAIIAPGLCMPIIFGLPFLEFNGIISDHSLRACIHKKTGYNLINPVIPPPQPPLKPKLKEQLKANRRFKAEALKELITTFDTKWGVRLKPHENIQPFDKLTAVKTRICTVINNEITNRKTEKMLNDFKCVFEPIPHYDNLPTEIVAEIKLIDPSKAIKTRNYPCPRKYKESWHTLIQQHLKNGVIRHSSSPFASPAFIIPKSDPTVLPRWVNDYRQLNENTITDSHPLPRIDDILNDCAKGKIWAKLDMTNSFFQTRMHPDHIAFTAVSTPFGLYEWLVMPMGLKNAPAIHQRRVTKALGALIGKICHIYLDDIVIWSNTIEEHEANTKKVLQALADAQLYCNPQKTFLYCHEINFLGHTISARGIEADTSKTDRITDWPVPRSATQVRQFLGLVRYISAFLPRISQHTAILTELTHKECDKNFPEWLPQHNTAFEAIKQIVTSRECLTTIDLEKLPKYKIFLSTDASDLCSGAVLSFGTTWETARPVAFDSMTFKNAELNYPVHEKELLAIIRALKKWRTDLIGVPFTIFTDHKTLENFHQQRDLSRRQARWMEFLSQYDGKIVYIKGEDNSVADALSRIPPDITNTTSTSEDAEKNALPIFHDASLDGKIASVLSTNSQDLLHKICPSLIASISVPTPVIPAILSISADTKLLDEIKKGYLQDPFISSLKAAMPGTSFISERNGFWFIGSRLVIPNISHIREALFYLAHDALGHFGADKSYAALRDSYYWPNMRKQLEQAYVPSCPECQRNKSRTNKPFGPLHPLPIPEQRGDSVAIDFIGPLPLDNGYDAIITFTDRLNSDIQIIPTTINLSAIQLADLFFDKWYCENGLPLEIISDRDKLFLSKFWSHLHKLTGIKLRMSTSYHPETDGASERSNKTVIQAIRFHVERNQKGWVRALPRVRFNIMNTVNKSTGFTPFQLRLGRSPRLIPPLISASLLPEDTHNTPTALSATSIIERLQHDVWEAQDNMFKSKISQAQQANKHRLMDFPFKVGQRVRLSTLHRRRDYKSKDEKRVVKFMPRFDGPYDIIHIDPTHSTVTLNLPRSPDVFPVFHTSEVMPFIENDEELFPSRTLHAPEPINVNDNLEHFIDKILDEKKGRGRGQPRFLVRWVGQGPEYDLWLPQKEIENCEALDIWLASKSSKSKKKTSTTRGG